MKLIIISGRSGSGKSVALHILEDQGFYCIDNLPAGLLPSLLEQAGDVYPQIAVSIDARNLPNDLDRFDSILAQLQTRGNSCEVLFLDADHNTLLKRYSETRRKHPLSSESLSLSEAITQEEKLLSPISDAADLRIDTNQLTAQQFRTRLNERLQLTESQGLSILFQSFGFKRGAPTDSDFIFDARCLPNPYWEPNLRPLTGRDEPVQAYLDDQSQVQEFFTDLQVFLKKWLHHYQATSRTYLTIAIGCTGGQHRSVYLTEKLYAHFNEELANVQIRHRELS